MASDLNALLTSSRALTSHLSRPDLPTINLALDQIEAQSRRLVSRQPGASTADTGRANFLLAQAQVDAPTLANSIAALNTSTTFSPLQPLHDTDVQGYLRHAHEQSIISSIEEGRRETQAEFYRVLDERVRRDWEARKKRIFEELGGRGVNLEPRSVVDMRKSVRGFATSTTTNFAQNLPTQARMMAYDPVITEFNQARLRGTSYPLIHKLIQSSADRQTSRTLDLLAVITGELPALPPLEHTGAQLLNAPIMERKYARAYLGNPESKDAIDLRRRIAAGAREALEQQYWDVMQNKIDSNPAQANPGGDPRPASRVRSFLALRFYSHGQWEERLEIMNGTPIWAKLFYLIRTGHAQEALEEALTQAEEIDRREPNFTIYLKHWVESPEHRLPKTLRDRVQSVYNTQNLHSNTADPFKRALFQLFGKLDQSRRSIPLVTGTTEDWLWFQLAMIDEEEHGGLRAFADVLLGYGERHFESPSGQRSVANKGLWARVLVVCGLFERAVAALYEHPEFQVEAVHLAISLAYYGLLRVPSKAESSDVDILSHSPTSPPAINFALLLQRYIRQFAKQDPKQALQYVYCVCLSADQPEVGKEQVDIALDMCRRVVIGAEASGGWEELVGGYRADGSRFGGVIERDLQLLKLNSTAEYNEHILLRAAAQSEREKRINEAIKLYHLAGAHTTVIACLARALGEYIGEPGGGGEEGRALEETATAVLKHYQRTNKAVGKEREAVLRLVKVREATVAREAGRLEAALEAMESTQLIPLDGDIASITRRAEEFKEHDDAISRNLQTFLPLTMEILRGLHDKLKTSSFADGGRQSRLADIRRKSRALMMFAGMLKYRMSPDVYSYLARLDVEIAL